MLRVDLHTHTHSSWDGWMSPGQLIGYARAAGLDRVAVTDHNRIDGAMRARDLDPTLIIVGEEIRCACGSELIGLYLNQHIPPGLQAEEVAERIRQQGGLVYVPHPYAYLTRATRRADRLLGLADIVEVFNGRAFWGPWNARARRVAAERALPAAASSDAHLPRDCGRAWTEVAPFSTPAELLTNLAGARLYHRSTVTPVSHVLTLGRGLYRLGRSAWRERLAGGE